MVCHTRLQIGLMLVVAIIAGALMRGMPSAVAATSTVPGTAVTIRPLDDFGKTVDDQGIETWAKALGFALQAVSAQAQSSKSQPLSDKPFDVLTTVHCASPRDRRS